MERRDTCSEVIYVRPILSTVFIDKHCCSSVLMLRPRRLEQSSIICMQCTADSFTSFRSQLKTYIGLCSPTFVAGTLSARLIPLPGLSRVINSLLTYFCTGVGVADVITFASDNFLTIG